LTRFKSPQNHGIGRQVSCGTSCFLGCYPSANLGFSFRFHRDFPQSGLGEHRPPIRGGKLITFGSEINFLERFLKGRFFGLGSSLSFPAPVIRLSIERNEHGCH
jgi:hypothetical protein